jgi:AbrB family looped-hinge helix DNA binding protein
MNSKVTLDQAGRVVLPKKVRDELHLSPGDTLEVTMKASFFSAEYDAIAMGTHVPRGVSRVNH